MEPAALRPKRPKRKLLFTLIVIGVALPVSFGVTELVLRLRGKTPWTLAEPNISVEPGGRLYQAHPTLGYGHIPGEFDVVVAGELRFKMSHDAQGRRITRPLGTASAAGRPAVWTFGCSFTHGWSVNDDETYPWLLQQRYPDHEVVNFAVNGYGTVHALLQLEEALASGRPPVVATLAYGSFHDDRNVFTRGRRKQIFTASHDRLGPLQQPTARTDASGALQIEIRELAYTSLPGASTWATMNALDNWVNSIEQRRHDGHQVALACIEAMAERCRAKKVTFVVATLSSKCDDVRALCESIGVTAVDLGLDYKRPELTNLPWDGHPSALAHKELASRLGAALDPLLGR